jgi:hypothetical protein
VLSAAAVVPASKLEHIPVRAYHMLRSLSREAINTQSVHGFEDIGLIQFLVSRSLCGGPGRRSHNYCRREGHGGN